MAIFGNIENYILKLRIKDILPPIDLNAGKILSSEQAQKYIKNKSQNYVKAVLSKQINELLENNSDIFIKSTADYLKVKFIDNEISIKNFLSKKIKDFKIDNNYLKSKELTNFIRLELYDKYKEKPLN